MIEFSTKWSLKLYSITKKNSNNNFKSIYIFRRKNMCVYIIERTLSLNFSIIIRKKNMNKISNIKHDVLCNV